VEQTAKLEQLLVLDASLTMTPFGWLKAMPVAPKADHIRELLDRLRDVFGDIDRSPPMPLATGSSISPYWMS
jgi:hypothetical protein